MRIPEETDAPLAINIVPMIDIIFSILAFFILSSLFLTRSEGLPVALPSAASGDRQPSPDLTLTVAKNGELFLDQTPVTPGQLPSQVKRQISLTGPSLVIINADQAVPHGQVVQVMDQLRQVEGVSLAIATTQPDDN